MHKKSLVQWVSEILHLKSRLFEGPSSNGRALAMAIVLHPTIENLDLFVRISNSFDKMAAICPELKWLGIRISDPIQNLDHLQPNLFLTI